MAATKKKSVRSSRILLKGGTLVTMNGTRDVAVGDVFIDGDRIGGVGEKAAGRKKVDEVIDCTNRLVIPGLIQPHVHLCQTLFRGKADNLELLDWLQQRIWPFEAAHTPESLFTSALVGGAELLRSGTTTILDMGTVRHTDSIFEACKKTGLRATIGKVMMDRGQGLPAGLRETAEESLAESVALAERWHGAEGGRLRYAFAPRFVLSCSEELLLSVVSEARARKLMMHTHASENTQELEAVRERFGKDNIEYLHGIGMSGEDTVLAHCVWLTSGEKRILADTGTSVVHCPSSNLKLASGFARIPELWDMGVNIGIAADGAPCSNSLDGFSNLRVAALMHKPRYGATTMPAEQVFEMATLRGARALQLQDEIGSIEEGKKADVVVMNLEQPHLAPVSDPYSMLVYAITGQDVEHVFVDGVQRVKKGKVLTVNAKKLVAQANEHAAKIVNPLLS